MYTVWSSVHVMPVPLDSAPSRFHGSQQRKSINSTGPALLKARTVCALRYIPPPEREGPGSARRRSSCLPCCVHASCIFCLGIQKDFRVVPTNHFIFLGPGSSPIPGPFRPLLAAFDRLGGVRGQFCLFRALWDPHPENILCLNPYFLPRQKRRGSCANMWSFLQGGTTPTMLGTTYQC